MAFSIYDFSDKLRNLVDKNNTITATYDISAGLSTRIKNVFLGYHDKKPTINILYPAVWVEPKEKAEDFSQLGNAAAKRNIEVNYEIVGIVQTGQGQFSGREVSDNEMMKLSANIDTLFRNKINLSNSTECLSAIVRSTEYDVVEYEDTWNSICKIRLNVKILSN